MWLLPQIDGELSTNMNEGGLALPSDSLYSPNSPSLNQAVVRININQNPGGTGSFISQKGLILTNYNVVYNALASLSNTEKNYLKEGFYADSISNEIPIPNYDLYITIEQREVTSQIKNQLDDTLTYQEKLRQSQKIRRQLIAERKKNNHNLVVEINDFWGGNRQFMSVYKVIRDVRLVHAPPESIGNFGGNASNLEWPQYSGDYAFLRAYVGPDGNSRAHNSSNVPFNPAKHLKINLDEVSELDFTLVMGYPIETFRSQSSFALDFYHNIRNPILIDSYRAVLEGLEYEAARNSQAAIKNAARRASLSNTIKYYRGLQEGVEAQSIINKRWKRDQEYHQWAKQDSLRYERHHRVLSQLHQAYNIASQTGDLLHAIVYTLNNNRLLQIAGQYSSYRRFLEDTTKKDLAKIYGDSLLTRHHLILNEIDIEAQQIMLSRMLHNLSTMPEGKIIFHLIELFGDAKGEELKKRIDEYLQAQRQKSIIYDTERAGKFLSLPVDSARKQPADELVQLYRALIKNYQFSSKNYNQYPAYEKPAQERYVSGMLEYEPDSFKYPDANGTLRISTGHVMGYSVEDTISYSPFTTMGNLLTTKTNGIAFDSTNFQSASGNPTVNFLTSNDVSGGNSGSPVLNDEGELVGITFDSNIEGITSDYVYNPELSRAICVDMQYILFLMNHFNADRLIEEMTFSTE